jgi:hypothetical protein
VKINPGQRPAFLGMDAFGIDFADIRLLAGSAAYGVTRIFYKNVKSAASADVSGTKTVYTVLRERFPHTRRAPVSRTPPDFPYIPPCAPPPPLKAPCKCTRSAVHRATHQKRGAEPRAHPPIASRENHRNGFSGIGSTEPPVSSEAFLLSGFTSHHIKEKQDGFWHQRQR